MASAGSSDEEDVREPETLAQLLSAPIKHTFRKPSLSTDLLSETPSKSKTLGGRSQNPSPILSILQEHLVSEPSLQGGKLGPEKNYNFAKKDPSDREPSFGSVSHSLLGGSFTRDIYKWSEKQRQSTDIPRSKSLTDLTNGASLTSFSNYQTLAMSSDTLTSNDIRASDLNQPGGFRRHFVSHQAKKEGRKHNVITRNFIDFLVLYGSYGGDIEDEEDGDDEGVICDTESTPLIPNTPPHHHQRHQISGTSVKKSFFLLTKAFVGTGVLFLPKAFSNGGLALSFILLFLLGALTLHCMLLLSETSREYGSLSFGDIGARIYGPYMRYLVLGSIAMAQIGFCCAYYIFVAQNLRDVVMTMSDCRLIVDDYWFIVLQVLLYAPLSWIRKISAFSVTSLIADVFILLGLGYVFYYDIALLSTRGVASEIVMFNLKDFPLFVGTALFSFEGICLILPIQESMKRPEKFNKTLSICILIIGIVFLCIGSLGYLTFGKDVATIAFLNLPNTSAAITMIQTFYGVAIMLSFPLTLYPAIRISETAIFGSRTGGGKTSNLVKWEKNFYRAFFVILLALVAWVGSDNLDKFVSLVGCFACIPLMFIYPTLFHTHIAKTRMVVVKDYILGLFGVFALLYSTSITLEQMFSGDKDVPINRCEGNKMVGFGR